MALALFLLEVNTANSLARQRVFRDRLNPQNNGFPLVGCIDCSHVPIIAPSENEHSINIQAICVHNLKFIDVVAR